MAAERITHETVAAELDAIDGEARRVAGGVVVSIAFTNAAVKDLAPREHEELAAYLFALIEREPVKTSPAFAGHRIVLGTLASELRGFAAAAGEPIGVQADLRAAVTQAEERRIRARLADLEAGAHRYGDDVIAAHHLQHQVLDDHIPPEHPEEDPPDEPPTAAQPTEPDDVLAYL